MRNLVLYHANCADGFCSAWVYNKFVGYDAVDYIPVNYGQAPPPEIEGRQVVILDFSYKRNVLQDMLTKATFICILDHHKTAQEELRDLYDPKLVINFDMEKSGAQLTWDHCFPGHKYPWLVRYTADRDFWKWELPNSKAINAALATYPFDFKTWDGLDMLPNGPQSLIREGEAILRYQEGVIKTSIKNGKEVKFLGHKIKILNATGLISEICGELATGYDFAATYFVREDGKVVWSLRTRDNKDFDVSELAKMMKGGGHKAAAGFETDIDFLKEVLNG